ncbi:MAG: enoyl-CoA hydratase/isomerase family protein [Pseudomonadota bacterium]
MTSIEIGLENHIGHVVLNRPEALNALLPEMLISLEEAVTNLAADESCRVIVLRGAGRAFSAGVDLKALAGIEPAHGKVGTVFDDPAACATKAIRAAQVPVIAQVHGFCFTGALEIALHCDMIYTTRDTKFGDTHVKWGLRPTWGMSQNLARAVGVRRARELSFTSRTFSGEEAVRWGLALDAYETPEALHEAVCRHASAIAAASPGAVAAMKALYRTHESDLGLEPALAAEQVADFPDIDDTADRLGTFAKS